MKYGTHITIQGRFDEVAVHEVGTSQKLLKVVHAWGNSKVLVCVSVCVCSFIVVVKCQWFTVFTE